MSQQIPSGYYRDDEGNLNRERRQYADRRQAGARSHADGERRYHPRRSADLDFVEREHHAMIEEALTEFAEEHERY